jgi:transcriptional regulator with XRE-family HTH domain
MTFVKTLIKILSMDKAVIEWIYQELNSRNISLRELAKRIGKSNSYVSKALRQEFNPGVDFYLGLAEALETTPEHVFRLAGFLPAPPEEEELLREVLEMMQQMTPEQRKDIQSYVEFIYHRGK